MLKFEFQNRISLPGCSGFRFKHPGGLIFSFSAIELVYHLQELILA